MKFNKIILTALAVVSLALSAFSQNDRDIFNTVRGVQIAVPATLAANATVTTNGPIDILGYGGRGVVIANTASNQSGTLTLTLQTSSDTTNWSNLANFALINSTTSVSYTNLLYGGTNLVVTDKYLLPFTPTYPNASTAGYATPYPLPNLFTNTAAVSVSASGTYVIGVNLTDCPRYLQAVWTAGNTNATSVVSAQLFGSRFFAP